MILTPILESLVFLAVMVIDIVINTFRLLRYGVLLPLTPLLGLVFRYVSKRFLDIEFGKDLVVNDWRFYAKILAYGELGAAESYVEGWWDSEDMESLAYKASSVKWLNLAFRFSIFRLEKFLRWGLFNFQTKKGALTSAKLQYNFSVDDLFKLFLGKYAVFSVGYFQSGTETLEEAQIAKMNLVAEKLQLRPGMKVLDLGCGFGALAKFLASSYGVSVVGVTNSSSMAEEGRRLCDSDKLDVKILNCDWRDVEGVYDRIVCIEMHEHVGWHNYTKFWKKIRTLLKDDGHFVLQTFLASFPGGQDSEFLARHMYGQLFAPQFHELLRYSGEQFLLLDYQNMRTSGIRTSEEMGKRLKQHENEIKEKLGIQVYRAFEIGLTGLPGAFKGLAVNHGQFVFYPKEKWNTPSGFGRAELQGIMEV